ncbi:hypothetical protein AAFO92_13475 [Roseovarius sp. CAU 1744]|uniref:hypothetical protein n=1 Tax=Roseovarius sp. CAU 1744 TaxID=3140368 RepID=UPI00325B8042
MKKIAIGVCLACALSGCGTPQKLAPVKDEPVRAGVVSTVDKKRLAQGTTDITVRAFKPAASADKKALPQEVVGVPCTVASDEVRAKVITPQIVTVPNFKQRAAFPNRGLPSALIVTCETGTLRGVASATSKAKQVTTATGGGLAIALITAATTAAVANSTPWVYPPAVSVTMDNK